MRAKDFAEKMRAYPTLYVYFYGNQYITVDTSLVTLYHAALNYNGKLYLLDNIRAVSEGPIVWT